MKDMVCKACGGVIERKGNYYQCKYCTGKWMADLSDDVHAVERVNAWEALRQHDFEKSAELFEGIIAKDKNSHEAYWGRALAMNSVVYVDDVQEDKRVPTCNNITEASFLENTDFKKAIALAPEDIASTYQKQAEQIEKIRIEWLQKARKEKPYDIFLSYKETEETGERTQDSIDVQDLYTSLVEKGYRVFFSRQSLRDKIAEHYEPYIYNAIKTAKVMIVFGETAEHFNAVWVKNEWTRFKALVANGEKDKNALVAVYKGMDAYDIPRSLTNGKQAIDYGVPSNYEKLLKHIDGIVNPPKNSTASSTRDESALGAQTERKSTKKSGWKIVALILCAIFLVVGGVYVLRYSNLLFSDTETSSSSNEDVNPVPMYTVTFDDEDGKVTILGNKQKTVVFNEKYGELPTCEKLGHVFNGWSTSPTGGVQIGPTSIVNVAENHTLYPQFSANIYKISLVNEGGVDMNGQFAHVGDVITLPTPLHSYEKYYQFDGWSDGSNIYNGTYTLEQEGVTLTAVWSKREVYKEYTYITTAGDFGWYIGNNLQKTSKPENCGTGKYLLVDDIDLGDWVEGWGYTYWESNNSSPTLNGKTCFSGIFDGDGHTIKYKTRIGKTDAQSWAFGLFPVASNATIKNLNVDVDFSTYDPQNRGEKWDISNDDRAEDAMVGGIVGYAYNTNIINCTVQGKVIYNSDGGNGDTCVGGVVGYAYGGSVINCSSEAEVYARGFWVNVAGVMACYYNTTYSALTATGKVHFNEDWLGGGYWTGNDVAKELQVL